MFSIGENLIFRKDILKTMTEKNQETGLNRIKWRANYLRGDCKICENLVPFMGINILINVKKN